MRNKLLEKKVKQNFDYPNLNIENNQIVIWYGITRRPPAFGSILTEWIPYGGGPLYGEAALEQCLWIRNHIEKFSDLLPPELKDSEIKIKGI